MKFIIVAFVCIIGINALSEKEQWLTFKQNHGKNYKNIAEENYRFSVFQNNLRQISEHNERYTNGETTYFLGVNKFADRTSDEFRGMLKSQKINLLNSEDAKLNKLSKTVEAAEAPVDWRSKGVVLPVRDQGDCGGSWPFAVAASIESQNVIINNVTEQLSTQQFIDCYGPQVDKCNITGDILNGFDYAQDYRLLPESEYPYVGAQSVCTADTNKGIVRAYSVFVAQSSEAILQAYIGKYGPMASTINADCIQLYAGGIFSNSSCPNTINDINFALLNVGYDTSSDGIEYWILKNSWGTGWGEEGYLRLKKGDKELGINLRNGLPFIYR
ncbi:unnamed protein product [Psylliodes chrysocephalus]|nr:unnamed protein product [Psylliodes chrysocephala]